jgi:hypothetical protein
MEYKYENLKKISINYLQGLEWVYKYYTGNCENWTWYYKYNYPPLFVDLCKFVPNNKKNFISNNYEILTPYQQLCYVLPKESKYLLPKLHENEDRVDGNEDNLNGIDVLEWSFTRYFWESHMKCREPTIPLRPPPFHGMNL